MPRPSTASARAPKRRRLSEEEMELLMEQLLLEEAPEEEEGIVFEPIEAIPLVDGAAVELRYYYRGVWLLYRYDVGRREIYHADYRVQAPPKRRRLHMPMRRALRAGELRRNRHA